MIFLTLKEAKGRKYQEIFGIIKDTIRDLYQKHRYLLTADKLAPDQKRKFQSILDEKATKKDYKSSLYHLSQYLYQYTGKKVYILLDEYDTPINAAYVHGYYEDCRSFLAAMLGKWHLKGIITWQKV